MFLKKEWIDPAFDYVMNNADEPVALEKAYAQMQSELAPKATAPASSVAEPNDWQTVAVPEYDAQGKPIASPQQKIYLDPNTGERIQRPPLDPNTGEPIQAPASQHKSAAPSGR